MQNEIHFIVVKTLSFVFWSVEVAEVIVDDHSGCSVITTFIGLLCL